MASESKKGEKYSEQRQNKLSKTVDKDSPTITQVRNASTGHWIVREESAGRFKVLKSPSRSITVRTILQAAPNPSVSKETAALAEKAVLNS